MPFKFVTRFDFPTTPPFNQGRRVASIPGWPRTIGWSVWSGSSCLHFPRARITNLFGVPSRPVQTPRAKGQLSEMSTWYLLSRATVSDISPGIYGEIKADGRLHRQRSRRANATAKRCDADRPRPFSAAILGRPSGKAARHRDCAPTFR